MMFRTYLFAFALSVSAVAFGQTLTPPAVPADIQVQPGNVAYLKASAVGTQNYVCLPAGEALAWKFQGPQATLFVTLKWFNGDIQQQVTTHYLSPSVTEEGTPARATWQSSLDTSAVWAKKIAESSDRAFVAEGAIPWFLLQVTGKKKGPSGGSSLFDTTFIQRVNTTGGIAPTTSCSVAGAIEFVPYTADYIFYRASGSR
jgi:hypothetical protein